jgi:hypothetical protein
VVHEVALGEARLGEEYLVEARELHGVGTEAHARGHRPSLRAVPAPSGSRSVSEGSIDRPFGIDREHNRSFI